MGQAVVDLPDPMEQPPAGASADDLLSQLAGDEIDRLLGESDVPPADPTEAEPEPVATMASPADAPPAPADAAPEPEALAQQLEQAKADAAAEVAEALPAAPPPAPSGELDQTIAAAAESVLGPAPAPPAAAEAGAERDGLLTDLAAEAPDDEPPIPLLLRPLEWLSRPLDGLSPAARDFLGKAAIVTLVNSIAVIAYVLWFRK